MSQEEVKKRMQLARLDGSNGMNSGRRGRRSGRSGGQDSNVFHWVDPHEQTKAFAAANGRKGQKATGAGTESTSTTSTSALSEHCSISRLTSHTPLPDVSTWTHNFFATPSITLSLSTFNVPTLAGTATINGFGEEDNDGSLSGGDNDADDLMVDIGWGLGSVWGSSTDTFISTSTLPVTPSAVLASVVALPVPAVALVEYHFAVLARQPQSRHGPKLRGRSQTTPLSASPSPWSTSLPTPPRGLILQRYRYRADRGCVRDDDRQAEEGSRSSRYEWEAHRRRRWLPLRPSLRR
jgi:hypothetical protein